MSVVNLLFIGLRLFISDCCLTDSSYQKSSWENMSCGLLLRQTWRASISDPSHAISHQIKSLGWLTIDYRMFVCLLVSFSCSYRPLPDWLHDESLSISFSHSVRPKMSGSNFRVIARQLSEHIFLFYRSHIRFSFARLTTFGFLILFVPFFFSPPKKIFFHLKLSAKYLKNLTRLPVNR